jgi:hypothetical protein
MSSAMPVKAALSAVSQSRIACLFRMHSSVGRVGLPHPAINREHLLHWSGIIYAFRGTGKQSYSEKDVHG